MLDFVETPIARDALQMCETVIGARPYSKVGQIIGEPGAGKTAMTFWLASQLNGVRLEAWVGIRGKTLLQCIAKSFADNGFDIDPRGSSNALFEALVEADIGDQIIIIDEANQLGWPVLELLRQLSDITGCAVILVGTDILKNRFVEARTKTHLRQLRSRIGTKKIDIQPFKDDQQVAAFILAPRFGKVGQKVTGTFRRLTKGYWRDGIELADACARIMTSQSLEKLDDDVVNAAAAAMAGK